MIRIGVIGAGIMGSLHAEAYQQNPNAELIAVCDFIREKAEKAAEKFEAGAFYTDYRKMIEKEELDAVAVATPDFAHTDPVITALEAGLDVIVEKPLATKREDADRIVKAVEKSGCKLMVNYGNRMRPQHRRVKQMIENDELGNPHPCICEADEQPQCSSGDAQLVFQVFTYMVLDVSYGRYDKMVVQR